MHPISVYATNYYIRMINNSDWSRMTETFIDDSENHFYDLFSKQCSEFGVSDERTKTLLALQLTCTTQGLLRQMCQGTLHTVTNIYDTYQNCVMTSLGN